MTRALALALALALASVAAPAAADPSKMLGFGPRGLAHAGGTLNLDDPLAAAVNNAALIAHAERPQIGGGYTFARPKITLNGADANLMAVRGFSVGAAIPFSYRDFDFGVGLAAYVPDQFLLRIHAVPATQPRAVMWDAPPHRLVANVAVAARYKEWVSFGVGASLLGRFSAEYLNFTIDATPGRTRTTSSLDFAFPLIVAPVAGLVVTPRPWLQLSARYTGEIEVGLRLPILAEVTVPGTSVDGPLGLLFVGPSIYTPRELSVGASGRLGGLTLGGELVFQNWAAIRHVTSRIESNFDPAELGVEVPASDFVPPDPGYRNTWSPRLLLSYAADVDVYTLTVRAGYSFVPTPVPAQRGLTNFADSNRHVVGLGGTFAFDWDWLDLPFELDVGAQLQRLSPRTARKDDPISPGGDLSIVGMVYAVSVGGRVSW